MRIQYLKNNEINFVRWDNCINTAFNGNVFAFSWYLNIICNDWEALVADDYKYVMPLLNKKVLNHEIIWSSKLGNKLGVFTNALLSENIVMQFIDAIPKNKSMVQMSLNKFNQVKSDHIKYLKSFNLDLIQPYQKIAEKYSNTFQKEVQNAIKNKISVVNGLLPNDFLNFSINKTCVSSSKLNTTKMQQLRMIIAYALRYNLGEIHGAYTAQNNLTAAVFFIKSKNNIYLLHNAIDKYGLKSNALNLILDKFIELHSEKNLTLNIENIVSKNKEYFLSGLGSGEYKFQEYHYNKLPWIYKLFIKQECDA